MSELEGSISRQDAIDALATYIHHVDRAIGTGKLSDQQCVESAHSIIDELPSAEITVEELKQIANELGYNIIKKQEYIKLLPCKCGCNRREHWYGNHKDSAYILKCSNCGAKAMGSTEREAKLNWNRMVSE